MNERIKQLAEQARKHFPKTETSGEFWVFDEEKFAQLIVKECMEVTKTFTSNQGLDYSAPVALAKHFGVEG